MNKNKLLILASLLLASLSTASLAQIPVADTATSKEAKTKVNKTDETAVFITPSLGYAHLKQTSAATDYRLKSDYYLFNLDIDLIDPSLAYHRLRLGHSLGDTTTQTYGATSENFSLTQMHAVYNVGIKKVSPNYDFALWAGLGWQATKVKDAALSTTDKTTRLHFAYIPLGTEIAVHHAGKVYMLIGAEYRLIMDGWENYQYTTSGSPQQSSALAYATWLGIDYLVNPKRALTFRLGYDYWEVKERPKDDLQGSEQKVFKLDIGIRF